MVGIIGGMMRTLGERVSNIAPLGRDYIDWKQTQEF